MIKFDEESHSYSFEGVSPRVDGRAPSVTQVIHELTGTQWKADEWYLQRGRVIHKCAELIATGKQFKVDPRIEGYVQALRKFFSDINPVECRSELVVGSVTLRYCGTLDLLCKLSGKWTLIDWKHSVDKIRIPLQLGGYSGALLEQEKIDARVGYGVTIKENGKYTITDPIDLTVPRLEFKALRTAYAVMDRCKCLSFQKTAVTTIISPEEF